MSMLMILKRTVVCLVSVSLMLSGCGGSDDATPDPDNGKATQQIASLSVKPGEMFDVSAYSNQPSSAELRFQVAGVEKVATLPLIAGKYVAFPVVPEGATSLNGTFSIKEGSKTVAEGDLTITPHQINTSVPGVASLVYVDATLQHVYSAYQELVTIGETDNTDVARQLEQQLTTLTQVRQAIVDSMAGTPSVLYETSTSKVMLDEKMLAQLDQVVTGMLTIGEKLTPVATASSRAQALSKSARESGGSQRRDPTETALATRSQPLATGFTFPTLSCSGLTDQADRAWCANMQTQIASDLAIAYTGMGAAGAGFAIGALAAVGVITGTAAVVASGLLAAFVMTVNLIAGAVQGASASGTGTSQGTNVADNIKNIRDTFASFLTSITNELIPGSSELFKQLREAIAQFALEKYLDDVVKLIEEKTQPVANCVASANSGGTGTFARIYDFGAPTTVVLTYEAYSVPDAFDVYDGIGTTASTGGVVSGGGSLTIAAKTRTVTVKVRAPQDGTAWDYTIGCIK